MGDGTGENNGAVVHLFEVEQGSIGLVGGPRGLREVILPGEPEEELRRALLARWPGAHEDGKTLAGAEEEIRGYWTGKVPVLRWPVDFTGVTRFRRDVYEVTSRIPRGEVRDYSWVADQLGKPLSRRAVGTALSRNPLPLYVPCHRVVRRGGGLGGFTSPLGLSLKAFLLKLEGVEVKVGRGFASVREALAAKPA